MKKASLIAMSLALLVTLCSCADNYNDDVQDSSSEPIYVQAINPDELTNKMTPTERKSIDKRALTLLDQPEKDTKEHKVSIEPMKMEKEEILAQLEESRADISEEDYLEALDSVNAVTEEYGSFVYPMITLIDGCYYYGHTPSLDYKGGKFTIYAALSDAPNAEPEAYTFEDIEEYIKWQEEADEHNYSLSENEKKSRTEQIRIVFDAVVNRTFEFLPEDSVDLSGNDKNIFKDPLADYRNVWEYDRGELLSIKDSITEYSIYDAELDTTFLVHVSKPPHYESMKTYPAFVMTDGVWRLGNIPELRKTIETGKASDVFLVSIGYAYDTDGSDLSTRYETLVHDRDKFLDFITDNLMPYLCEQFNIDCQNSTLYGHSDGGVFTHNALFKADKYENQPFGRYIIGSPSFWGLYDDDAEYQYELDPDGCQNDYGYFDLKNTIDKKVFLCGGEQEDPDYADKYNGHYTTLEGLDKLRRRLENHNADVTYKLYDSHHYQYIPEMLVEYLKKNYPPTA